MAKKFYFITDGYAAGTVVDAIQPVYAANKEKAIAKFIKDHVVEDFRDGQEPYSEFEDCKVYIVEPKNMESIDFPKRYKELWKKYIAWEKAENLREEKERTKTEEAKERELLKKLTKKYGKL